MDRSRAGDERRGLLVNQAIQPDARRQRLVLISVRLYEVQWRRVQCALRYAVACAERAGDTDGPRGTLAVLLRSYADTIEQDMASHYAELAARRAAERRKKHFRRFGHVGIPSRDGLTYACCGRERRDDAPGREGEGDRIV